jgi:hypothetical protein
MAVSSAALAAPFVMKMTGTVLHVEAAAKEVDKKYAGMKSINTDQLAYRWMDRREIQNLMGKYVYYKMLRDETKLVDDFWADMSDACLGVNNGYYKGLDAIRAYYEAVDNNTAIRTKHMKKLFPLYFGSKTEGELHGVGSLLVDALTTCVIEQAEDGQTAKAAWYVLGQDTDIHPEGPYSYLAYGAIAADFIMVDDEWKIWHMVDIQELTAPAGVNWTKDYPAPETLPEFASLAGKLQPMPEPTVPENVHTAYYKGRGFSPLVKVPEPYVTFADTFSYGI